VDSQSFVGEKHLASSRNLGLAISFAMHVFLGSGFVALNTVTAEQADFESLEVQSLEVNTLSADELQAIIALLELDPEVSEEGTNLPVIPVKEITASATLIGAKSNSESSPVELSQMTEEKEIPEPEPKPEPKPVEVEETVEVQKSAEVQKAVEEKEAEVVIAQQQEEVVKEEAQIAVEQDAEKSVEPPKAVTIISAPAEEPDEAIYDLEMVYFAYDKSIITTAFGEALQKNYEWIAENPDVQIQLEGHCDERGTNEYNLALGERRAKAVFDYLISLGASPSQFSLVSFGEERPAEQGSNEVAWGKNRRVEFIRL